MTYYNRNGYCEEDRMSYSEQKCYGTTRPSNYLRPHHNNQMQVSECDSYTATNYGQGGGYYAPTPAYNSGACYERKEEMCMSNTSGGRYGGFRPSGHRRRRVMKHCESRGSYSSSESDSD